MAMNLQDRWGQLTMMGLPALVLLGVTAARYPLQSAALVASSIALFGAAWWSARQLMNFRGLNLFAALGLGLGWFAEQMGSSHGWFFGRYTYTDMLGPRLGDVPVVIPMMWFALCWVGFVLAKLLLWRDPLADVQGWVGKTITALLAAMLVTAFDLGADPYFVFVLKAWIMEKTDGGWFGETLQGFAGWMLISFLIVSLAQLGLRSDRIQPTPLPSSVKWGAGLPIAIYASGMVFQMIWGHPIETRAVAFFAMGIPVFGATAAWWHWQGAKHGL
jgi:uncharacterized membrane protein